MMNDNYISELSMEYNEAIRDIAMLWIKGDKSWIRFLMVCPRCIKTMSGSCKQSNIISQTIHSCIGRSRVLVFCAMTGTMTIHPSSLMVLFHGLDSDNWYSIRLRHFVRLGRTDYAGYAPRVELESRSVIANPRRELPLRLVHADRVRSIWTGCG